MLVTIDGGKTYNDISEVRIIWNETGHEEESASLHLIANEEGVICYLINDEGDCVGTRGETAAETAEAILSRYHQAPKAQDILVHVGVISHRFGINVYTDCSRQGVNRQIYEFVTKWWSDFLEDQPVPQDHQEAIEQYFAAAEGKETLDFSESSLSVSLPLGGVNGNRG